MQPLGRCHCKDFELPCLVLRYDRQGRRDIELHTPGDELLHNLRAATEGNAVHGNAGELLELARENLLRRAGADGRIAHLAGMRLGVAQEIAKASGGNAICQREPVIVFGDQRDRSDITELELRFPEERGVDRLEMSAQQQRVTVARLRQRIPGRDHAGCGRLVFHDHALAQHLAQLIGHEARRNIGRAAGAEAHDQPDRTNRVGLLGPRRAQARGREQQERAAEPPRDCEHRARFVIDASLRHDRSREHLSSFQHVTTAISGLARSVLYCRRRLRPRRDGATAISDSREIRR